MVPALYVLAVVAACVAAWILCAYARLLRALRGRACPGAPAPGGRAPGGWPLRAYLVHFQAHGDVLVCESPDARALERDVRGGRVDAVVMGGAALAVRPGYVPGAPAGSCVLRVAPLPPGQAVLGARLFGPTSLQDLLVGASQGQALLIGIRLATP